MTAAFHRWADLPDDRPRDRMLRVGVLELPQCWVYMVEAGKGFRVPDQVHRSEQVVQVIDGGLRLHVGEHGARDLGYDDLAVIPVGTHHHGLVLEDSRVFELNCPRDAENLYDRRDEWPVAGEPLHSAQDLPLGPFVRWSDVGAVRRVVLGELVEVARHSVPAGSDTTGTTRGGVFQVLRGALRLSVNGEEQELTPEWVAVMQPGDEWRSRTRKPAELFEVFFR